MATSSRTIKTTLVVVLVAGITVLHYTTRQSAAFQHIFYRDLYFLPIILAGFWQGLRGGLFTSLTITILYLPSVLLPIDRLTAMDFGNLLQVVLFNVVGCGLGLLRDREVRRQRELQKTESLAAMGKAVSAVAHDMKTPLVAIGGFTAQVRRGLSAEEPACKKLDLVLQQVTRLETMVKDMLAFARPLELQKTEHDLNTFLQETLEVASEAARQRGVKVHCLLCEHPVSLQIDHDRLQQAVLNLLSNAIEATPESENVTVSLSSKSKSIHLEIADRGEGIPRKRRKEIFSPFFTTKKDGTGLGLAIVKKIVEAHEGNIEVLDNQEKGTIFRITLSGK